MRLALALVRRCCSPRRRARRRPPPTRRHVRRRASTTPSRGRARSTAVHAAASSNGRPRQRPVPARCRAATCSRRFDRAAGASSSSSCAAPAAGSTRHVRQPARVRDGVRRDRRRRSTGDGRLDAGRARSDRPARDDLRASSGDGARTPYRHRRRRVLRRPTSRTPTITSLGHARSRSPSTVRSAARFAVLVDGGTLVACTSPFAPAGLAPGAHTLPASARRRVRPRPTRTPAPTTSPSPRRAPRRRSPTPTATASPTRATTARRSANADQADGDKDGVGDACELLPPGNVPPVAGETAVVKALSGEVFVKLPTRRRWASADARAVPGDGLRPAQGRRLGAGRLDRRHAQGRDLGAPRRPTATPPRTSAPSASRPGSRPASSRCKQKRAKKAAKKTSISTDIGLLSPPGAEAACAKPAPAKGVVRTLSMVAKGCLPHARRREHGDGAQRDVQHHRPLRRHAHRGRQGPRLAGGQGHQEAGRRARRAAPTWSRRSSSRSRRAASAA